MKYKGKVVSGSSLLTILGVVCFATVIVSAVLVTSNALTLGSTTVSGASIVLSTPTANTTALVGDPTDYGFNANVAQTMTDATITIYVNETSILPADVGSVKITYGSGTQATVTMAQNGASSLSGTYTVTDLTSGAAKVGSIVIVYNVAGTYAVAVKMGGHA
jgi:hypothetical protein